MDLILWRHAEAQDPEDGMDDLARALTRRGEKQAARMAAWLELEKSLESGEKVKGVITGKVKGGLTVMTKGIRAFLPGSLVDLRTVKDTSPYEGKEMEFKVIKLDRKRNNVVVSRRASLAPDDRLVGAPSPTICVTCEAADPDRRAALEGLQVGS